MNNDFMKELSKKIDKKIAIYTLKASSFLITNDVGVRFTFPKKCYEQGSFEFLILSSDTIHRIT